MAKPAPRTIVSTVRAYARQHGIFRPGPLVVAVSGGTDSAALALILAELRDEFGLVLHIAHFDHRTRPRSSAKEADFVARLADRIGAAIRVGRAERAPKSEDDARNARYRFLRRAAMQLGAGAIATGHTMDDQAETVLLHLTRGAGLAGVAAMRPLRDGVARPLLAIGRAETLAICRSAKVRPLQDPSNRSLRFARNRVRLKVLPELERINPQVRAALARFADAAAEAEEGAPAAEAVEVQIAGASPAAPSSAPAATASGAPDRLSSAPTPRSISLDVASLPSAAAARDRALAQAWRTATGVTLTARQRAALSALAATTAGSRRIDLPGGRALREYAHLELATATPIAQEVAPLALQRGSDASWHGWRIALDMRTDGLPYAAALTDDEAARIVIRARRPGDRVRGSGKLQDVFVDSKVPARRRDTWPLVTLNGEDILWVPGVTEPPRSGSVSMAVGPAPTPVTGDAVLKESSENRQVASKAVRRPRGGNRERG